MKRLLSFLIMTAVSIQLSAKNEIKGRVVDENAQPLEFVTVALLNQTDSSIITGTTTDFEGNFVIASSEPKSILRFSSVGYQTKTIETSIGNIGDIVMNNDAQNLDEITIEAPSIITKSDRQLYVPKEGMAARCTNGTDFLSKLKIPDVFVNKVDGSISLADNGNVTLCINGRPVNAEQIRAIDPNNIKRVEYHDKPSMRWGDAKAVIDFIVENPDGGGNAVVQHNQALNNLYFNDCWGEIEVFKGKSALSFNLWDMNRQKLNLYRINEEKYQNADGSYLIRKEDGQKGKLNNQNLGGYLEYSITDSLQLLSVSGGIGGNKSTQHYNGIISSNMSNYRTFAQDHNNSKIINSWGNIYYHRKLKNDQMIIVSANGNWYKSSSARTYNENSIDSAYYYTFSTATEITEPQLKFNGEVDYEKGFEKGRITVGVKQNLAHTETIYKMLNDTTVNTQSGFTYAFVEGMYNIANNMDLTAGLAVNHNFTKMEGIDRISSTIVQPRVRYHWRWSNKANFNLTSEVFNRTPSIGQLSQVEQQVDTYQSSTGNSNLKNYIGLNIATEQDYNTNRLYVKVGVSYSHVWKPIMEEKRWNDDHTQIISSSANQKALHSTKYSLSARAELIKDWLSVGGNVRYLHTRSIGNNYSHTFDNFAGTISAELSHYDFTLQWLTQLPHNSFYGETMEGNEFVNLLSLDYRINKQWTVTASCLNPFLSTWKVDSENRNQLAGYKRSIRSNMAENVFLVKVNYKVNWGKKHNSSDYKRINNNSENSGGTSAAGK